MKVAQINSLLPAEWVISDSQFPITARTTPEADSQQTQATTLQPAVLACSLWQNLPVKLDRAEATSLNGGMS